MKGDRSSWVPAAEHGEYVDAEDDDEEEEEDVVDGETRGRDEARAPVAAWVTDTPLGQGVPAVR